MKGKEKEINLDIMVYDYFKNMKHLDSEVSAILNKVIKNSKTTGKSSFFNER